AGGYYTADGMTKDISVPIAAGAFIAGGAMSTSSFNRPYTITINQDNSPLVQSRAIVYLNFEGGNGIRIGGKPGESFGPFDAASINPIYSGHTDEIISEIVQQVKENYADYNVIIYSSRDNGYTPPPSEPHTTLYFGGEGPKRTIVVGDCSHIASTLLGLSDRVDSFDMIKDDNAIVYTNNFDVFCRFFDYVSCSYIPLTPPTIPQISTVIANTVTHEIGHTFGLAHILDSTEIMDTSATAQQMLLRQLFHRAPLNPTVFPIGYQDSPKLLEMTLRPMLACTDSDGGQVYNVKGALTVNPPLPGNPIIQDTCVLRIPGGFQGFVSSCPSGPDCYIAELMCSSPDMSSTDIMEGYYYSYDGVNPVFYYVMRRCNRGCTNGACTLNP
ncbi:MAG: hypothetical protein Q7S74_00455, partial [Nanoarchaeota archaeon]|nr:hypothetical protein [Nanoarchaeota archaeon]